MVSKRVRGTGLVCLGLGFALIVFALMPQVVGLNLDINNSGCLTIKNSAYGNGLPVCWRRPSPEFQGIINAEAYKLGYDVQPDGTYKRVAD